MRAAIVGLVRLLIGLFYRRFETTGFERIPAEGPALLVANHFNSLVDPMLVIAAVDRPVTFVAKSTLWKVPALRPVLRALGVVPIVRRIDVEKEGETGGKARNEESFERLAAVLRDGGVVLIFPEGRSHSEPALGAVKTGAARILRMVERDVAVVPLGLFFTRKDEFRSDVLIAAGERVAVPADRDVEAATESIRAGLASVTLNARSWDEHRVVAAVESLYGEKLSEGPPTLERTFRNRRLLLGAYAALEAVEPGAVRSVARRARALDRLLRRLGLAPGSLDAGRPAVAGRLLLSLLRTLLGFPFALLGLVAFWVPYRLCGVLALRIVGARGGLDVIALYKIVVGLVAFPVTYGLELFLVHRLLGAPGALGAALVLPLAGLLSLWYFEALDRDEGEYRRLLVRLFAGRDPLEKLRRERDALRAECDRLAAVHVSRPDNPVK